MTYREAINVVAPALEQGETRFQIALVGYFLDGRPYPADGLAVNSTNTPNFIVTTEGFSCDGFFPSDILDGKHRSEPARAGVVRVRVAVNERDVWAIAEFTTGHQIDLFIDPGVMIARKFAFAKESAAWRESAAAGTR
jgi:hypothetical protein